MVSASLLAQARRSAGFSQRALAARAGVAQQEIARYERGRVTPSLERLRTLIAACGLELTFALTRADDSYDAPIATALALAPAQRLLRALGDAQPLRAARAQVGGTPAGADSDPIGILRALEAAAVRYVLIGELAEALHGSPLLPITSTVTIVARAGQRDSLGTAIAAGHGHPAQQSVTSSIDTPARFTLEAYGAQLVVAPAPAGTHGYEDLQRDASPIRISEDLTVTVASLLDLVRIAEASEDRGRVPALRRTLELAMSPPAAPDADAA